MPNRAGQDRLISTIRRILDNKENKEEVISGMLGRYNELGVKEISVADRPGLVHVRIRGQTSEPVQAFNETAGLQWGQAILLKKDPYNSRFYRVIGKDTGKYQEWPEPQQPKHGRQHSFALPSDAGRDIAFIYKRQMAQPLLAHPQSTADMTVYVEPDFYFWNGQNQYFSGGSSPDLTSYKPADSFGRFVTVYLDGGTGTIKVSAGSTFSETLPPTDVVSQIPSISTTVGIPLVAVYLTSTTATIGWADLFDIRIMLLSGGTAPLPHALDPIYGSHTGSLPARNVSVADPSGVLTSQNVEDALFELYSRTSTGSLPSGWEDHGSLVQLAVITDQVGIGVTLASAKLHVVSSSEQLRLGTSATDFVSFTSASGDLIIVPSGGDTSITGTLDVSGHGVFGADGSIVNTIVLNVQENLTDFGGLAGAQGIRVASTQTITADNANSYNGINANVAMSVSLGATATSTAGGLRAGVFVITATGAGTITTMHGFNMQVNNSGSGVVVTARGGYVFAGTNTGGGSITNLVGLQVQPQASGTNNCELILGNTFPTGNYGIYAGSGHNHYLDSSVGINQVTASARLHVTETTLGNEVCRIDSVATNDDPSDRIYQNRITTTNNTQTNLHTYTVPASTSVKIHAEVVARRTGGSAGTAEDGAGYEIIATVKNVAGTATLIGAVLVDYSGEDQAGWDATIDVTAATARIRVTGATNNNVTWHLAKLSIQPVGS